MRIKYIISTVLMLVIVSVSLLAWSTFRKEKKERPKKELGIKELEPEPLDTALLSKFAHISEQFDLSKRDILLVGKLNVTDGADSAAKIVNAPYIFSKRGKDFYCKLGYTETINANGLYLFVDHELKKIMVSTQKEVMPSLPMPNAKQLLKSLKGEGYTLSSNLNGKVEKLAFSNPLHLSCKEYALLIDQESNQLQGVLVRLSNMPDTENSKKDKLIELKLSKISNEPALDEYINQKMVKIEGKELKLGAAYQNYELITN